MEDLGRYYRIQHRQARKFVDLFYNKINTYRLAEKTGIPIPLTFYPGREKRIWMIPEYPSPALSSLQ